MVPTSWEAIIEQTRPQALLPSGADLRSIAGADGFVRDRKGRLRGLDIDPATCKGRERRRKFMDAMAPYIRAEGERCLRRNAAEATDRVTLRNRTTGSTVEVPRRLERAAALKHGMVAVEHRRPTLVYDPNTRGWWRYQGRGQWVADE